MRKEAGTGGPLREKLQQVRSEDRSSATVGRVVWLSKGIREERGWAMDVVDGNLQSLCSCAVMSTINKRNVVR